MMRFTEFVREMGRLLFGRGHPPSVRPSRLRGFVTPEDLERERLAVASLRFEV